MGLLMELRVCLNIHVLGSAGKYIERLIYLLSFLRG